MKRFRDFCLLWLLISEEFRGKLQFVLSNGKHLSSPEQTHPVCKGTQSLPLSASSSCSQGHGLLLSDSSRRSQKALPSNPENATVL